MTRCTRCGSPEAFAVEPDDCESCAQRNPLGIEASARPRITDHGDGTFTMDVVERNEPGRLGRFHQVAGLFTVSASDEDDYIRREQELMARGYDPSLARSAWFTEHVVNGEG